MQGAVAGRRGLPPGGAGVSVYGPAQRVFVSMFFVDRGLGGVRFGTRRVVGFNSTEEFEQINVGLVIALAAQKQDFIGGGVYEDRGIVPGLGFLTGGGGVEKTGPKYLVHVSAGDFPVFGSEGLELVVAHKNHLLQKQSFVFRGHGLFPLSAAGF